MSSSDSKEGDESKSGSGSGSGSGRGSESDSMSETSSEWLSDSDVEEVSEAFSLTLGGILKVGSAK